MTTLLLSGLKVDKYVTTKVCMYVTHICLNLNIPSRGYVTVHCFLDKCFKLLCCYIQASNGEYQQLSNISSPPSDLVGSLEE